MIFSKKKNNWKKNWFFFFWKMKKSEKNNALFLYQKNLKFQNTKNRKNWIFFVPFVCTLKIFYETTLWCSVVLRKLFYDFSIRSRYLKFRSKKIFPKKTLYHRNFGEKNLKKNRKIQIFGRSAKIGQIFLGGKFVCIGRICCINI